MFVEKASSTSTVFWSVYSPSISHILTMLNSILYPFESGYFDTLSAVEFTVEHTELPILCVALYLVIVFYGEREVVRGK